MKKTIFLLSMIILTIIFSLFINLSNTTILSVQAKNISLLASNTTTKITLYPTNAKIDEKGRGDCIYAEVTPAKNQSVTWTSSNNGIAEIKNVSSYTQGNKLTQYVSLNPHKTGTVTLTAKTKDGKKATCKVTIVKSLKPTVSIMAKIYLDKSSLTLTKGKSYKLKASVVEVSSSSIKWSSSNSSVAKVDSKGNVTALKAGTATITASILNGTVKATCKVTVKNPSINVIESSINLKLNKSQYITIDKANSIKWYTSNSNIVSLTNPNSNKVKITGKKCGNAQVYVTINNTKYIYNIKVSK